MDRDREIGIEEENIKEKENKIPEDIYLYKNEEEAPKKKKEF